MKNNTNTRTIEEISTEAYQKGCLKGIWSFVFLCFMVFMGSWIYDKGLYITIPRDEVCLVNDLYVTRTTPVLDPYNGVLVKITIDIFNPTLDKKFKESGYIYFGDDADHYRNFIVYEERYNNNTDAAIAFFSNKTMEHPCQTIGTLSHKRKLYSFRGGHINQIYKTSRFGVVIFGYISLILLISLFVSILFIMVF